MSHASRRMLIGIGRPPCLALGPEVVPRGDELAKHQRGTAQYDAVARKVSSATDKRSTCHRRRVPTPGHDCLTLAGPHRCTSGP